MEKKKNHKCIAFEKELKSSLSKYRIETLEEALNGKEKELQEEKAKFAKLKEDFKYNLKVLEERDQELERYDITFSGKNYFHKNLILKAYRGCNLKNKCNGCITYHSQCY